MKIKGYAWTVVGGREQNQDSFLIDDALNLYAVADGVGGGLNGDVASRMAVDGLKKHQTPDGRLKLAVEKVQNEVLQEALATLGEALMGTTLTAVRVTGELAVEMVHVGDSHCYVFHEGVLQLMNEDHESFDENLQGAVLSSYLGLAPEVLPLRIQEETFTLATNDKILLCTDGLYKQVSELEMIQIIQAHLDNPQKLLQELCAKAEQAEYSDNVTIVWITVEKKT